ncbi:MAG: formate dehydrogenase accessory protein FdhE [Sutterella parvirubra]|nr:formate dehydrogenase accessory protein FdhE [Sutterella parvirubra]MDY5201513.1 formate dehydrogenase accessory protein FdhE [Sutterella parvirubra]
MKLSVIDRAIAQYADLSDPEAAFRLKLLAPILRETAKIADDLPENAMEAELPDAEAVEALRRGADPIMTTGAVKLSAAVFADVVARLAAVHEEALRAEEFNVADIDWTLFASDDAVALLSRDPEAFLTDAVEAALAVGMPEDVVDVQLIPVLSMAVRAMLTDYAEAVSDKLASGEDPVVDFERRLSCPVCGSEAAMAVVGPTARSGNVKQLCCLRCGSHWKFERIRCAHCGDEAVSDLRYIHDEADQDHRLHVCADCGETTPTVFVSGTFEQVSPDVEAVVLGALEAAWREAEAAKAEEEGAKA